MTSLGAGLLAIHVLYAVSFIVMGVTVWLHIGRTAKLGLTSRMQLLAAFGLLHGLGDLSAVARDVPGIDIPVMQPVALVLIAVSFVVLLWFGLVMTVVNRRLFRNLLVFGGLAAVAIAAYMIALYAKGDRASVAEAERIVRLFVGMPGGVFATLGFVKTARSCAKLGVTSCERGARIAAVGMGAYSFLVALIATKHSAQLMFLGLPVQFYRLVAAVVLTVGAIEMIRRLELTSERKGKAALRESIEAAGRLEPSSSGSLSSGSR